MGILSAAEFSVRSTVHKLKDYILGQLIFGQDMIILIEHTANWKLVRQSKQAQIIYNIVCEHKIE